MANDLFNIARGRIGYYMADALGLSGANSRHVTVVLSLVETDDALNNHDDLGAVIAATGNAQANATGYARIETAAAGITINIDDTANDAEAVVDADQTWTSVANNDTNGDWNKLLCCYDADNATGTDANIVPLTYHDFVVTPNGGNITADFDQTNGFWRST